jgi:hypothetical protein
MAPPVDRYIAQMRLNHPDRVKEEMYDLLVGDTFRTFAGHFGLTTSLRIVFTPSRRAERLRIGGESWLIYDQYLGQTFNILNRIFFNAEGEREAIAYFHKYIAERTLEYGQAELGIEPANFYADQKDLLRKTVDGDPLRAAFTILAEQFAVFHELSHEILDSGHDFAGFYMGIVADSIASKREFHLSRTAESVVEGFRNGNPAAYHDAPLDDVIAETLADFDSPEQVLGREAYIAALDDPDVAEELFCDFVACDLALMGGIGEDMELRDALKALYIASYHLKTLDHVDRAMDGILLPGQSPQDHQSHRRHRSQAMQVRNHCLRDHLLMMYSARLLDREEDERSRLVSEFAVDLMKDQRRYYEAVLDPATKTASFLAEPGRLQEMAAEHDAPLRTFALNRPDADPAMARNVLASITILKQTGWPISAIDRFAAKLRD